MATPSKFRDRPRVTSIEDADVFPLSRVISGVATTCSIVWSDMSAQIIAEVDDARADMVAGFATAQSNLTAMQAWTQGEIDTLTAAVGGKEPTITAGTTAKYWRGDKSWQPSIDLPISTLTQAALDAKLGLPGTPVSVSPAFGTAYQATANTKAAFISVMVETNYSITIAGTLTDTVELRIGTVQATVANGTSGIAVATFKASLTGITLTIGLGNIQRNQLTALLPAGWYYALRRVAGTTATLQGAFDQPIG